MLLGIVGLCGVLVALFLMEQELNRIGFFNKGKHLPLQLPQALQKEAPNTPPAASSTSPQPSQPALVMPPTSPSPAVSSPSPIEPGRPPVQAPGKSTSPFPASEGISAEDRKRLEGLTSSQSPEKLSQDDRKSLEDILRKHPK